MTKHTTVANYNDGTDHGNEDGNDNGNDAYGSGSDGKIFDPITTPLYCIGVSGNDIDGNTAVVHYMSTLLNICHKLLNDNFDVSDWCRCHTKK